MDRGASGNHNRVARMRIAAIYDIHGNLPALEAVLHEIRAAAVDAIVVGGDVIPGPMPREVLNLLRDLTMDVRFLYGNGEVAVLAERAGRHSGVAEQYRDVIRWNAEQIDDDSAAFIASWPKDVRLHLDGIGTTLFCHASPRNENECFTRTTPAERLAPLFDGVNASVVVCGHTHMQFDRMIGRTRVVNAGSVGMPFGAPAACWLLLAADAQLRQTHFDLDAASERIRRSGYPQASAFAQNNVLQPPSETQMLEIFSRVEIK